LWHGKVRSHIGVTGTGHIVVKNKGNESFLYFVSRQKKSVENMKN
jgi:hypothetical protein